MNECEEQRVIEALQAFTGGLAVTEQDMLIANNKLKGNLEPPSPLRRLAAVAVVAAAAVVAGLVIFQATDDDENSAPPPAGTQTPAEELVAALQADPYTLGDAEFIAGTQLTPQALAGLWLQRPADESLVVDEFTPVPMYVDGDGDWRIGHPTGPFSFGDSTLAGAEWNRQLDETAQCAQNNDAVGVTWETTASIAGDGSLRVQRPGRRICALPGSREVWNPVAPGTPLMDYFDAASAEVGWQEGSADVMEGVYVAPETGYMLIVNPARDTYRYYEDLTAAKLVPTEEGTFTTDSSGLYGTCDKQTRAGDTFEGVVEFGDIPGVAGYVHPRAAVRITPGGPQCGPVVALTDATTEQTLWVRLFQYGTAAPFRE